MQTFLRLRKTENTIREIANKNTEVLSNDSKLGKSLSNKDHEEDKLVRERRIPKEDRKDTRDKTVEEGNH